LIVEHEAIVRLELADRLTETGLRVLVAKNADEAIDLLNTHPEIELLLTNIKMPGSMDGIRLSHHVRDRWPPVKIIVMSGIVKTKLSELPRGSIFFPSPTGLRRSPRHWRTCWTREPPAPLGRSVSRLSPKLCVASYRQVCWSGKDTT
jgi:hypothetical protein